MTGFAVYFVQAGLLFARRALKEPDHRRRNIMRTITFLAMGGMMLAFAISGRRTLDRSRAAGDDVSAPGEQDSELGETSRVAVVVAHPDDETLWAGGLLLSHPEWSPFIVTLCRGKDPDRAPKFLRALERLSAKGTMGDLDDGPDQVPLPATMVQDAILSLLPGRDYDILLTHAPDGEYTRHRRHEEVSRAVWVLWRDGDLRARRLWQFAYEDGGGAYFPRPRKDAYLHLPLSDAVWTRKYGIITEVYGFGEASWEAQVVPRTEAFGCFSEQE